MKKTGDGGKRRQKLYSRDDEKERARERRREGLERKWGYLCVAPLHSITIIHTFKLARRTEQVSPGGRPSLQYFISTLYTQHCTHEHMHTHTHTQHLHARMCAHTNQSITSHTGNDGWLYWIRTKVKAEGQVFWKQSWSWAKISVSQVFAKPPACQINIRQIQDAY